MVWGARGPCGGGWRRRRYRAIQQSKRPFYDLADLHLGAREDTISRGTSGSRSGIVYAHPGCLWCDDLQVFSGSLYLYAGSYGYWEPDDVPRPEFLSVGDELARSSCRSSFWPAVAPKSGGNVLRTQGGRGITRRALLGLPRPVPNLHSHPQVLVVCLQEGGIFREGTVGLVVEGPLPVTNPHRRCEWHLPKCDHVACSVSWCATCRPSVVGRALSQGTALDGIVQV